MKDKADRYAVCLGMTERFDLPLRKFEASKLYLKYLYCLVEAI